MPWWAVDCSNSYNSGHGFYFYDCALNFVRDIRY